jgi:SAM-dependent methyltransferase
VAQNFFKFLRGSSGAASAEAHPSVRPTRKSSGLGEFTRAMAGQEGLCVLDLGPTSPPNITHVTGLGHKIYNEDVLLASRDPELLVTGEKGAKEIDVRRFLAENLLYQGPQFDAVLCWDVADYLPEQLVKPVIERICAVMRPGGVLLAFFHTRDAGPEAPYYRYHMSGKDTLELQAVTQPAREPRAPALPLFRLQRVFNNRHIENLFREFASLKFFLGRDNIRDVLVVR